MSVSGGVGRSVLAVAVVVAVVLLLGARLVALVLSGTTDMNVGAQVVELKYT